MSMHDLIAAVRGWRGPDPLPPLRAADLGLERFPAGAVLLQFSSVGSRNCRDSLNRLSEAAAHSGGRVTVVEQAIRRSSALQTRLGVRFTPSVYVIAADGSIVHHWARPPDRRELAEALAALGEVAPALAGVG
jgi:thioredoxin-like negative regulator of GroEL